jgi:hypothetical protein
MLVLEIILWMITLYLVFGLAFAIPFVLKGAGEIDEGARGATWGFKLIIIPATAVFWPFLLHKWIREKKKKRNAGIS